MTINSEFYVEYFKVKFSMKTAAVTSKVSRYDLQVNCSTTSVEKQCYLSIILMLLKQGLKWRKIKMGVGRNFSRKEIKYQSNDDR